MAIDFTNYDARSNLQRAVRDSYEHSADDRERRKALISIYRDRSINPLLANTSKRSRTLINTFQNYARGQQTVLAFNAPRWDVTARSGRAVNLAVRSKHLLNRMNDLLGMQSMMERWALDTVFGRAVAKVCVGIAPKGINVPYSPRAYRISPNYTILDPTASTLDECSFIADFYLVPLLEAINYQFYDPIERAALTEWNETGTQSMVPEGLDSDSFAEPMTRLIDVYLPSKGVIATWPCGNDQFYDLTREPLMVRQTQINPYEICDMTLVPDEVAEFALLDTLRPIHEWINDAFVKATEQMRDSKRNPVAQAGFEHDLDAVLNKPDGEGVFLENMKAIDLYTLPGPDPSVVQLGMLGLSLFSQFGGNLEVALGQSAGADTARQTQALLQQLGNVQGVIRMKFERFLSNIGKKLATLAFASESFALDIEVPVPGTSVSTNWGWAPPHLLPRTASIDDFNFSVVPYSTAFRSPEQKVSQTVQATQIATQLFTIASQGAPINLQAALTDLAEAFDLVTNLPAWWSGEAVKPSPEQQAANTYATTASQGPSERQISYQSSAGPGSGGAQAPAPQPGGLAGFSG